ncbi:glycosyltransferase [Zavarzinella formosa]|uniref:glycosyltransferase n=1 Tax=Zavarzinella formosa TaxID=360055 RepID=UPI00031A49B1|nr:glycosyltransferase [Zavarzinella formosa]
MTSPLFVVSDPVLRDQLALLRPSFRQPVAVADLAEHRRGIWDFRKLLEFRRLLAQHRHIHALGQQAAKTVALAGVGLKFSNLWISGDIPGASFRYLNREFATLAWPWAVPPESPPLNREETLAKFGIPPTAFVFASASRLFEKIEALPSIWGFEMLRYPQPDIYLLIHGDGPKAAEVEELTRNLAPEGTRIRLVGTSLPLAGVFGIADVVIATNEESVMAALTARKPIIAPRIFSTMLRDGEQALLMEPAEPPTVGKKMTRLFADENLRMRLVKAAEPLREQYSPANAARELETARR